MSPEQASDQTVDARSDLFSLGCVLYRLATGTLPFQGPHAGAVLRAVTMDQPKAPRRLNPALPLGLSLLIMKLLAKRPDDRPESARAVVQEIEAIERPQRPVTRQRKATPYLLAGAAAALFVTVGLAALQLPSILYRPTQPRLDEETTPRDPQPGPPSATELANKAEEILRVNCYGCHGKNGTIEGGFNFVLDTKRLISRKKVVAGRPDESLLFKRLTDSESPMPPRGEAARPKNSEIDSIRQWIAAGAAVLQPAPAAREFISDAEVLQVVRGDLKKFDDSVRPSLRYFTITHLHNAGLGADELQTYRLGLAKLVNSLSCGPRIDRPKPIDRDETVFRIDLRNYGWGKKEWEHVVEAYPYDITYDSQDAQFCYSQTQCKVPCVRADWFVFAASRPPLYHALLQLPETGLDLENKLQVKVDANVRDGKAVRAGFRVSGIAVGNRLIERHDLGHGAYYWKTYDFARKDRRQNIFEHPLGPGSGVDKFQQSGSEIIFSLPNDLQGYMLVDGDGKRIDEGPPSIVSDTRNKGFGVKVINGISCMSCHTYGINVKADEIRTHVENNRTFHREEIDAVLALHPTAETLAGFFRKDRARFAAAVTETGAAPTETEPVAALALRYDEDLDVNLAAAEAGVEPNELLEGLNRSQRLARAFAPLKNPGGTISRQVFADHDNFDELLHVLHPGASRPKQDVVVNSIGMRFQLIPPGKLFMGSPQGEKGHQTEEELHEVEITRPFYMGVYEVTQGEFQEVMKRNPSYFKEVKGLNTNRFPVESVSWEEARKFCDELSKRDKGGRKYRLPTEAEWEYACRGGTQTPYHVGERLTIDQANIDDGTAGALKRPREVGFYPPNPFGMYDMHGNVSEWCADVYEANYYKKGPPQYDPKGPEEKPGSSRVLRGGNFDLIASKCRSADRNNSLPDLPSKHWGFRVVFDEPKKAP
jgi:formylglycine-generating enzyme required for sulfatase activity/mono/diheme cytochrome c family protein